MGLRIRVCAIDEVISDELRAFPVEGIDVPILVTRVDGAIVAASSMCPHEDVSLVDGVLEGAVVECPGHAYRFDLATGACLHDPDLRLRRYRVIVEGPDVFVDLIAEP
ncbi:MAG TPA: Rieske 2Fe-2S domain-containing protein [Kofleriaceae bacterium]|nr:Rieske 2Fe-2S domain-containing protein [Kofleriaceae bacterium]